MVNNRGALITYILAKLDGGLLKRHAHVWYALLFGRRWRAMLRCSSESGRSAPGARAMEEFEMAALNTVNADEEGEKHL